MAEFDMALRGASPAWANAYPNELAPGGVPMPDADGMQVHAGEPHQLTAQRQAEALARLPGEVATIASDLAIDVPLGVWHASGGMVVDAGLQAFDVGQLTAFALSGGSIAPPVLYSKLLSGIERGVPSIMGGKAGAAELMLRAIPGPNFVFAGDDLLNGLNRGDRHAVGQAIGALAVAPVLFGKVVSELPAWSKHVNLMSKSAPVAKPVSPLHLAPLAELPFVLEPVAVAAEGVARPSLTPVFRGAVHAPEKRLFENVPPTAYERMGEPPELQMAAVKRGGRGQSGGDDNGSLPPKPGNKSNVIDITGRIPPLTDSMAWRVKRQLGQESPETVQWVTDFLEPMSAEFDGLPADHPAATSLIGEVFRSRYFELKTPGAVYEPAVFSRVHAEALHELHLRQAELVQLKAQPPSAPVPLRSLSAELIDARAASARQAADALLQARDALQSEALETSWANVWHELDLMEKVSNRGPDGVPVRSPEHMAMLASAGDALVDQQIAQATTTFSVDLVANRLMQYAEQLEGQSNRPGAGPTTTLALDAMTPAQLQARLNLVQTDLSRVDQTIRTGMAEITGFLKPVFELHQHVTELLEVMSPFLRDKTEAGLQLVEQGRMAIDWYAHHALEAQVQLARARQPLHEYVQLLQAELAARSAP
jgi:hypothetical protein